MPIYEYKCKSCGKKFSALVKSFSTRDEDVKCPGCSEHNSERQLSLKAAIGGSDSAGSASGCSAPLGSGFT